MKSKTGSGGLEEIRVKGNLHEHLLKKLDEFVNLPASSLPEASKLGEEISKSAREFSDTVNLPPRPRKRLDLLVAKISSLSSRLTRSVANSRRGTFRRDWARFAQSEIVRLKDEALALREFLLSYRRTTEKKARPPMPMPSLPEIIEALHSEGAIHEVTYAKIIKCLSKMGSRALRKQERRMEERLLRMWSWLSDLRKIRRLN